MLGRVNSIANYKFGHSNQDTTLNDSQKWPIPSPSIDLQVALKRKLDKEFKKVGPICSNLSYKSQLRKVWAVLVEICLKSFVCKIQNPGQINWPSIDLKVVLKRKWDKNFKKVGPICGSLSFKSQKFQLKTAQTYWQYFFCQIDVEISKATLIFCKKQCATMPDSAIR